MIYLLHAYEFLYVKLFTYSPHSANSPDRAIFHERRQPLSVVVLSGQSAQRQLNCPLI